MARETNGNTRARSRPYDAPMSTHHASCSCGQLSVDCDGDPVRVSVCHCLSCQRRTGSVFGVQARFARERCRISGASTAHVRTGDSGGVITFHFCPACGATVHYAIDAQPDLVAIPVGAFADPGFPAPTYSVYEARQHGWVRIDGEIEHHP